MNYTYEKLKNQVKFTITLTAEEWAQANEQAYNQNKGKYSVQGFRKGHVPKKILENIYGKGVFFEEAFNIALPKYYAEVLDKEKDIYPVDQPEIDIKDLDKEGGIEFTALVTVKPEVKLGDYKGIKIKRIEYNVTEADVEAELKAAQERASRLVNVEGRAAEKGDTVIIDYSGSIDGKKFEGGTAEKQNLELGSGTFIPGFEDQVIGMNAGEEKDINVKFPEDYHKDLAGKEAVFHIKLHEIKKKELPEINDEFAKDVSEFDTLDLYKKSIVEKLEKSNKTRADSETENALLEAVTAASETEIPQVMIDNQAENMVNEFKYRLMYQGMKFEDYLKYANTTEEKLKETYREQAEKTVKSRLVLEEIIKRENITATEEEKKDKIREIAEKVNKSFDEYYKGISLRQLEYIENEIITDKLFRMLKDNAVFD
jgi:trigger factor